MLNCSTVGELLSFLGIFEPLQTRVQSVLSTDQSVDLLVQLQQLPLKKSHAATRLGSYSCRGTKALSIRLQFAQEEEQLIQTLLHEIAHFLDHQTRTTPAFYRNPHGRNWKYWLQVVGADSDAGTSVAMRNLYQQRLKSVARCERCGHVLRRLRRLPQKQRWLHRECGGLFVPIRTQSPSCTS